MLRLNVFAIMFFVGMVCLANHYVNGDKVCMTNGGNEVNKACIFPFIYGSHTYETCTKKDSDKEWCYTEVDSNGIGVYGKYGYCDSNCKTCPVRCNICPSGSSSDGGLPTNSNGICEHFCSVWGACGNGAAYNTGDDCRGCTISENLECTTAHVGSSESNSKTITINGVFSCPSKVDKTNWFGVAKYNDKFRVSQAGNEITATRTDSNGGWSMDLKFQCCLKEQPNLEVRCCELRGVPRKCIYACDLKTDKKISQREANNYDKCTNYMDVIDNCRKDPTILEDMKDCCDLYDVHKTPDCHELVCNSKCEDKEWRFLEKHPKKECKNHVKNLKSCCGGD